MTYEEELLGSIVDELVRINRILKEMSELMREIKETPQPVIFADYEMMSSYENISGTYPHGPIKRY